MPPLRNRTTEQRAAAALRIKTAYAAEESRAVGLSGDDATMAATIACRAICYAAIMYGYDVPVVTDDVYWPLVDCYDACDLHIRFMYRDSSLESASAELCVMACAACVTACAGSTDPMLEAVSKACGQAADASRAMYEEGEAEEEGRARIGTKVEVRNCAIEVRAAGDKTPGITGYPIVFEKWSEELAGPSGKRFREMVKRGAVQFDTEVRADFNHDSNYILGRASKGTLKLAIDDGGVRMDVDPPDTQWARDLMGQVERGDIDQGSFAFRVLPGGESWSGDGTQRTLTKILVSRVSLVADPAYTQTSMQVRAREVAGSQQTEDHTAGHLAPPVESGGGVGIDLLRRSLDLTLCEVA